MKCFSKKVIVRQYELYQEEHQQERQEYLDSLSEVERNAFLEREKTDKKRGMKVWANTQAFKTKLGGDIVK